MKNTICFDFYVYRNKICCQLTAGLYILFFSSGLSDQI